MYRQSIHLGGAISLDHDAQEPALHEGTATMAGRNSTGRIRVSAGYVSFYQFQIMPDDAADTGPWDIEFFLITSGHFSGLLRLGSAASAKITARAAVDRLSDFTRVYQGSISDKVAAVGRIFRRHNPILFETDSKVEKLQADEYNVQLITEVEAFLSPAQLGVFQNRMKLDLSDPHGSELELYVL